MPAATSPEIGHVALTGSDLQVRGRRVHDGDRVVDAT